MAIEKNTWFFKNNNKNDNNNISNEDYNDKNLNRLADKGDDPINLIKSIKTSTIKSFPEKHYVRITLTCKKLRF